MTENVNVLSMPAPEFDRDEVLRYAGCRQGYETDFPEKCFNEIGNQLRYSVCYGEFPLLVEGDVSDLGFARIKSGYAARMLSGCRRVLVFAATVGIATDRIIARYSRISPVKSLMFQALGTERVESLCNEFCSFRCERLAEYGLSLGVRFSPGYGDIPLSMQQAIFAALDVTRNIGVCLTDALMMVPTKSVTAIAGIRSCGTTEKTCADGCALCQKKECIFRKV